MWGSWSFRLSTCAAALTAGFALAQGAPLVSGPGVGLVTAKCGTCHDVTHITRSKLTRDEWTDNFENMVKRGMPRPSEDETRIILDYLTAYYGPRPPPPAAPDTLAAAAAGASGIDPTQGVGRILSAGGCTACHAVDKPLVGPSFDAVAARYRGDAAATAKLSAKIRHGGAGVWGPTPMPPNAVLSDREVQQIVEWVLARN